MCCCQRRLGLASAKGHGTGLGMVRGDRSLWHTTHIGRSPCGVELVRPARRPACRLLATGPSLPAVTSAKALRPRGSAGGAQEAGGGKTGCESGSCGRCEAAHLCRGRVVKVVKEERRHVRGTEGTSSRLIRPHPDTFELGSAEIPSLARLKRRTQNSWPHAPTMVRSLSAIRQMTHRSLSASSFFST
jgi:hypothetical protein